MAFSSRDFRDALGSFATGVCVITCPRGAGEEPVGLTVNSFTSVSLDPPLVLWCLDKKTERYDPFAAATGFAVSILARDHHALSVGFADLSWVKDVETETWETGAPLLKGFLAGLDCAVEARHEAGDHVIMVGRVLRLQTAKDREPLVYYKGNYGGFA